jgi:16S rRNA (adenine1518-N6/adenine1519-N6)-dimethyltransferase
MNLSNINRIKEVMEGNNLTFKKKFGQNFLIDQNVLRNITNSCKLTDKTGVIEIGPGLGSLTEFLSKGSKKVVCYEIDTDLIEILRESFKDSNTTIVNQDILKVDIKNDINKYFNDCEEIVVCSNLPYYITSAIMTFLLENNDSKIKRYVLMMQKEVADKFVSGTEKNALNILIELFTNSKKLFNIPKNVFYPKPNVDSSVILLERKENIEYNINNYSFFFEFIQNIYKQRRKTLLNNILDSYNISKEEVVNILNNNNVDINIRTEQLSIEKIIIVSDVLSLYI